MKKDLKDWEIARIMYGKNGKHECKLVAELRKYGVITDLCEGCSIITDSRLDDDCGWLIPNECLEKQFSDLYTGKYRKNITASF